MGGGGKSERSDAREADPSGLKPLVMTKPNKIYGAPKVRPFKTAATRCFRQVVGLTAEDNDKGNETVSYRT